MEIPSAVGQRPVRIRFLGHNCFVVDDGETCVVTDPWFSTRGAFHGSWFQYPPNQHLAEEVIALADSRDLLVYVSHEHSDHFDNEFLSRLPRGTRVCTARYTDRFLAGALADLGVDLIEVDDGATFTHGSAEVTIFRVESGIARDSAALISMGDVRFLDQNDCKMFDRLHELPRPVTHYAAQFSGASWYPVCFDLSTAERRRRAANLTANKIRNVGSALASLTPSVYLPSAGPVVFPFLSEDFDDDPEGTTFIHQDNLATRLDVPSGTRVAYLRPGEFLDETEGTVPIQAPTENEIDGYAARMVDVWSTYPDLLDVEALLPAIEQRLSLMLGHDFGVPPLVEFVWGDQAQDRLLIDLNAGRVMIGETAPAEAEVTRVSSTERYFALLASDDRWQEVVHSFRASVTRRPDVFNNAVNLFLYSDSESLGRSLEGVTTDRFAVTADGRRFELDRRCPHQGADLSRGVIEGGCVVCPRHGWRFDLEDAGSDSRSGTTVNAFEVGGPRPH